MCKICIILKTMRHSWEKSKVPNWRYIPCSWIKIHNIASISVLFKTTYIFKTISSKILPGIFVVIDKLLVNFKWNFRGPKIAITILKENKIGGCRFPDFETSHKVRIIQTVWHWCMNRHIGQ